MTFQTQFDQEYLDSELNQVGLLHRITYRIRRSPELTEILNAAVQEVAAFLNMDRVKIYQFHTDGSGRVVAEVIREDRLPPLLGLNFPADDIPPEARELFIRARIRSVVDVEAKQISQTSFNPEANDFTPEFFRRRPLNSCHVEYLTAMGVKSSLVIPILHDEQLWGLLACHNAKPRHFLESELQIMELVSAQLSVAIAQSTLLSHARAQAERGNILNHIANLLHSFSRTELQAALEKTVQAFQGSGGRLCVMAHAFDSLSPSNNASKTLADYISDRCCDIRLYTCGTQPIIPELARFQLLEQYSVWQDHFHEKHQDCWAIENIYEIPALRNLQPAFHPTPICSVMMVALRYRQKLLGYLSIFRDAVEVETPWAGQFNPDQRQVYPRQSFEIWRQSKTSKSRPWTPEEIDMAQTVGFHFSTALQQYETHEQLQTLNSNLEDQVQERTLELQQATEQQKLLFQVVTKMRNSLDLKTIFATVTGEVRRILSADRVGVYQFDPDSTFNNGEFIAEDVLPEFPSAIAIKIHDHCFGERYASAYQQGRVYAIPNVQEANLEACFLDLLNQFQIKATLVAPLMKGQELWGLLCIHQCAAPRHWEASEVQFATQIATQLSVALEQSSLLIQTQEQAEQLTQTLSDLKQTQTQLVQTEKMSSLGQLVAGVAHEINNPVNFIHGNLKHASEYVEDLLDLLKSYQNHYPNPVKEIREQAEKVDLPFLVEDLPKTLSSMKVGTERIRQIVLSLRSFSRLDQAEMKPVDIHEGIESTLMILQHRFKVRSDCPEIQLIKEYGDLPLVECYPGQLNQVFMNLLSNAIDALEEWDAERWTGSFSQEKLTELLAQPSTIRVRTEQVDADRVAIRISDNGKGISEEARRHLFDAFFTTKPVGKGTGLGLSISYQIVTEKHGGNLTCISKPGEGAEFVIEIPIQQSRL